MLLMLYCRLSMSLKSPIALGRRCLAANAVKNLLYSSSVIIGLVLSVFFAWERSCSLPARGGKEDGIWGAYHFYTVPGREEAMAFALATAGNPPHSPSR